MCDQQVAGFISAPRNHAAALLRDVKTTRRRRQSKQRHRTRGDKRSIASSVLIGRECAEGFVGLERRRESLRAIGPLSEAPLPFAVALHDRAPRPDYRPLLRRDDRYALSANRKHNNVQERGGVA